MLPSAVAQHAAHPHDDDRRPGLRRLERGARERQRTEEGSGRAEDDGPRDVDRRTRQRGDRQRPERRLAAGDRDRRNVDGDPGDRARLDLGAAGLDRQAECSVRLPTGGDVDREPAARDVADPEHLVPAPALDRPAAEGEEGRVGNELQRGRAADVEHARPLGGRRSPVERPGPADEQRSNPRRARIGPGLGQERSRARDHRGGGARAADRPEDGAAVRSGTRFGGRQSDARREQVRLDPAVERKPPRREGRRGRQGCAARSRSRDHDRCSGLGTQRTRDLLREHDHRDTDATVESDGSGRDRPAVEDHGGRAGIRSSSGGRGRIRTGGCDRGAVGHL